MKKMVKDIGMFSVGSVTLGASASAVGKGFGGSYSSGLSTMSTAMPVVGGLVGAKHGLRQLKKVRGVIK